MMVFSQGFWCRLVLRTSRLVSYSPSLLMTRLASLSLPTLRVTVPPPLKLRLPLRLQLLPPPPRLQRDQRRNVLFTPLSFAHLADPPHTRLGMPALSPTMTHGNVGAWVKKEGDSIKPGDALCEIETDKATMTLDASEEGFLARIVVPPKTKDVPLGKVWTPVSPWFTFPR